MDTTQTQITHNLCLTNTRSNLYALVCDNSLHKLAIVFQFCLTFLLNLKKGDQEKGGAKGREWVSSSSEGMKFVLTSPDCCACLAWQWWSPVVFWMNGWTAPKPIPCHPFQHSVQRESWFEVLLIIMMTSHQLERKGELFINGTYKCIHYKLRFMLEWVA